jgi:hypothetical protein
MSRWLRNPARTALHSSYDVSCYCYHLQMNISRRIDRLGGTAGITVDDYYLGRYTGKISVGTYDVLRGTLSVLCF